MVGKRLKECLHHEAADASTFQENPEDNDAAWSDLGEATSCYSPTSDSAAGGTPEEKPGCEMRDETSAMANCRSRRRCR